MSQLRELAKPFPQRYVKSNPSGGGQYVKHSNVTQRLLQIVGPFTFEVVEVIRGDVDGVEEHTNDYGKLIKAKPERHNVIVGVLARLTIEADGLVRSVEEVGDCEQPHNWPTDGARLKDAMSDALKRCAMRFGLGLHLWCQEDYYLYDRLADDDKVEPNEREDDAA